MIVEYQERIDELKAFSLEENTVCDPLSEKDLVDWIRLNPGFRLGSLVLVDDGSKFRLIWDKDKTHFGLLFRGDRKISYVIFKPELETGKIVRWSGRENFEGIEKKIEEFELLQLLK